MYKIVHCCSILNMGYEGELSRICERSPRAWGFSFGSFLFQDLVRERMRRARAHGLPEARAWPVARPEVSEGYRSMAAMPIGLYGAVLKLFREKKERSLRAKREKTRQQH